MQFDVCANPIVAARRAYPWVVVLLSDFARDARDQIVAPMAPRKALPEVRGRLTPIVTVESAEHVLLIPGLTGVRRRDLLEPISSVAGSRDEILAAIDYLFFGV